jgi:hypothetical protein
MQFLRPTTRSGLNCNSHPTGGYAESIGALLLVPIISMAVYFRMQSKEVSNA